MVFSIVCPGLLLSFQFSEYDTFLFCYHFLVKNFIYLLTKHTANKYKKQKIL